MNKNDWIRIKVTGPVLIHDIVYEILIDVPVSIDPKSFKPLYFEVPKTKFWTDRINDSSIPIDWAPKKEAVEKPAGKGGSGEK